MKNTDIVCFCSNVTVKDVQNLKETYEGLDKKIIKESLRIGLGCGSCLKQSFCERTNTELFDNIFKNK